MKRTLGLKLAMFTQFVFGAAMLLLCLLALAGAALKIASPKTTHESLNLAVGIAIFFFAAVGPLTAGVGVYKLKLWGRTAAIVSGVILLVVGALAGLGLWSQIKHSNAASGSDRFACWLAAALVSLGALWAVYFSRSSVRKLFVPDSESGEQAYGEPKRPLSITIIGVLYLVGALFEVVLLFHRQSPGWRFGVLLSGREASAYWLVQGTVDAAIAIGLLKLWPFARKAAIAFSLLFLFNSALFFFLPNHDARINALEGAKRDANLRSNRAIYSPAFQIPALLVCTGIPLFFLVTRGAAFDSKDDDSFTSSKPQNTMEEVV